MKTLKLTLTDEDEAGLRAYARAIRDLLRVKISDAEVVRRMIRQAAFASRPSADTQPIIPLKRRASDRMSRSS